MSIPGIDAATGVWDATDASGIVQANPLLTQRRWANRRPEKAAVSRRVRWRIRYECNPPIPLVVPALLKAAKQNRRSPLSGQGHDKQDDHRQPDRAPHQ